MPKTDVIEDVTVADDTTTEKSGNTLSVKLTHDAFIKGWINFDGTGTPTARDSYNVSSITDLGTGEYTVVWDTNFANDDYAVGGMTNGSTDITGQYDIKLNFDTPQATTGCSILTSWGDAGANWQPADFTVIHVIAIGDQ